MISKSSFQLISKVVLIVAALHLSFSNSFAQKKIVKFGDSEKIAIAISFLNAKVSTKRIVQKNDTDSVTIKQKIRLLTVSLIDPQGKVQTINGYPFKTITVMGGVMSLSLPAKVNLPYQFVIRAEAEGYVTNYRSILIEMKQSYYFPISMIEMERPPADVFTGLKRFEVSNSQTLNPINIKGYDANFANSKAPYKVELTIPKGTTLYAAPQKKIDDTIQNAVLKLSYAEPNGFSSNAFPSGFFVPNYFLPNNLKEKPTNKIKQLLKSKLSEPPQYLTPYCWTTIDLRAGQQEIVKFNDLDKVTLKVIFKDIGEDGSNALKNGSPVTLWSINHYGVWQKEGAVYVDSVAGDKLFSASFQVKHFSTWVLASTEPACPGDLVINYESNIAGPLYSQLILDATRYVYHQNVVDYLGAAGTLRIINPPRNRKLLFIAYDDLAGNGGLRGSVRINTTGCNGLNSEMLYLNIDTDYIFKKNISFQKQTSSGDRVICNFPIWFKRCVDCSITDSTNCDMDEMPFEYGGYLNTFGKTILTQIGFDFNEKSCIRIWYGTQTNNELIGSDWLDIIMDFSENSTPRSILAKTKDTIINIEHWYDGSTKTHMFRLPDHISIDPITTCW